MTNEISKNISVECGIEPKKVKCPHRGCYNHVSHPCEVCNNARVIEVYPDFTQPELFVRLIETPANHVRFDTVLGAIGYLDYWCETREEILDAVLEIVKYKDCSIFSAITEAIKQEFGGQNDK
jgi:hypothetical protein